jgi:hypothetical protein
MSIIIKEESSAGAQTPASGKTTIFVDSADGKLKRKDDTSTVTDIEAAASGVTSFEGRAGVVVAAAGDYTASEVTNVPAGDITAITVQAAINELDTEKAPAAHVGAGGVSEHPVADGSTAGFMSPSDKTKLDGVASGATANDTDANLKNRANHTGTQAASTISDFDTVADARVTAGILTHVGLSDPHPGYAVDADVTAAQAFAAARGNHTGSQTASTISDFTAASKAATVQDAISNGITDVAPSQNAVFDALAGKSNTGHTHVVADITDYATSQDLKADIAGDTFTGPVAIEGDSNGTGYLNLKAQNTNPASPASGVTLFANVDERLTIKGQSGFAATIDKSLLTQDRFFTLPDADGELLQDPMSTIGDMIYRDGSNVTTRLPVGANGYLLRGMGGVPVWEEENLEQDFGDGSDGNLTVTGALTLTDNTYYDTLTVGAGAVINTDGYQLYCKVLDLSNAPAGSITRSGNAGTNVAANAGGAGGSAFTARVLATNAAGGSGAAGQTNAGVQGAAGGAISIGNGGSGGASGTSGAGGTGIAANGISGGAVATNMKYGRFEYQFIRGVTSVSGGAGGRGGNSGGGDGANSSRGGGGGGAGGAVLAIYAGTIITSGSTPSGVIVAKGGQGGRNTNAPAAGNVGGSSGAGGGGGGYIYLTYIKKQGVSVSNLIDASGGNGGDGSNGLGTGIGGNGGQGGTGGRIQIYNVTTGAGSLTIGAAGNAGTTGSGVTAGVGGTGGACVVSL